MTTITDRYAPRRDKLKWRQHHINVHYVLFLWPDLITQTIEPYTLCCISLFRMKKRKSAELKYSFINMIK